MAHTRLPRSMTSIFRQYRDDADTVATWLVKTALEYNYDEATLSTTRNPKE
ncbi:hypothetical protein ACKVWC_000314 [Pyricularia oryzae]|uniref:Uncharacterized protein n=1 Tax=Pyricularia grisea TaxID=148305 RepID=A0ABQ8NGY4_PYRGI|nr:hypothetical protein MCOR01_006680 [Pyricularia oryzae]KAI6296909.1 hypothetical protein MCOR33_006621 [Pyricularia grisea]KAI6368894.1 hypothetical protein MCOR31_005381 [Pyricularia oryzae]KAI6371438.1 hypothetical protein MCOR32_006214 [Pyricularia oryzae]KAI6422187.1 hypothetical protein MCOR21_008877 [Pyricularia oryzae]